MAQAEDEPVKDGKAEDGRTEDVGAEEDGSAEDGTDEGGTDEDGTDEGGTGDEGGAADEGAGDDEPEPEAAHEPEGDDAPDEDAAAGSDGAEDAPAEDAAAGSDEADAEPPRPLPALEPAHLDDLMAAYHQRYGADRSRLPWSWSTLSPGERDALAELIDGFVGSYNRIWAPSDAEAVPSCWHRHTALAYDLAALTWAYYQAYVDPAATADVALRFQGHLPRFGDRLDRWLGTERAECRAGRHTRAVRAEVASGPGRTSVEDADTVLLLGAEQFGFTGSAHPEVQSAVDHREADLLPAAEEPAQQHP